MSSFFQSKGSTNLFKDYKYFQSLLVIFDFTIVKCNTLLQYSKPFLVIRCNFLVTVFFSNLFKLLHDECLIV
ncbi:hypothetical protein Fmac_001665 [Flemingia macrophylla]|uniref:Uncharacterized protein n=1 Tax=Flemingia macrophylla TaxID=520843 RepID=A0ABD1NHS8_9FABA